MVDVCRSCPPSSCLCAPGLGRPPFSPLFHKVRSKQSVECFVTARMAFAETPPGTAAWRVWQLEAAEHVATVAVEVERYYATLGSAVWSPWGWKSMGPYQRKILWKPGWCRSCPLLDEIVAPDAT